LAARRQQRSSSDSEIWTRFELQQTVANRCGFSAADLSVVAAVSLRKGKEE